MTCFCEAPAVGSFVATGSGKPLAGAGHTCRGGFLWDGEKVSCLVVVTASQHRDLV